MIDVMPNARNRRFPLNFLLGLFLVCLTPRGIESAYAQTQHEMNQQAEAEAADADKQLNAAYKKLMAALDDEGTALLRSSQRAWILYRDAEAKFAGDAMRGGSAEALLYFGTIARLTLDRTQNLKEALEAYGAGP